MRYFDASAIVKHAMSEAQSDELRSFVAARAASVNITSVIARTETAIAIARQGAQSSRVVADGPSTLMLRGLTLRLVDVDDDVARAAADIGSSTGLRSLDAIHVATAMQFGPRLIEVVTYDKAMIAACQALDLPVVSPGA